MPPPTFLSVWVLSLFLVCKSVLLFFGCYLNLIHYTVHHSFASLSTVSCMLYPMSCLLEWYIDMLTVMIE